MLGSMESKLYFAVFYSSSLNEKPRFDSMWDDESDAETYARLNNKRHAPALNHFVAKVLVPAEVSVA